MSSSPLRPAPSDLRCEHLVDPLGLDETAPRFSWKITGTRLGAAQTACHIQVAATSQTLAGGGPDVWDSGKLNIEHSVLLPYGGPALRPHTRYHWRVRVWDQDGLPSRWSKPAWFETGFLKATTPWPAASWIGLKLPRDGDLQPARYLRKGFHLRERPREARLYITARGVFEPYVNGRRIGCDALAPGWTDYNIRIEYLTYDVTEHLRAGENAVGAILADGWYAGYLGWPGKGKGHHYYGDEPALLALLRIVDADGSLRWIGSGSSWHGTAGPLLSADLYHGEAYDARRELGDWSAPGYDGKNWRRAHVSTHAPVQLNGKASGPVRPIEELKPIALRRPGKDIHVFDLGQNMVGVARLRIRAPRGTKITLRYAEMLQADGSLYTANLRSARATDTYVCRGGGTEIYEPRFTFHGFRYVGVSGFRSRPRREDLTGIVLHSAMEPTGSFATSHPLVNQLQHNIRWGQKGNFFDVPTDCPQRDERLGWTGDAQVFITTACFNYDVAPFFHKWMRDLSDDQHPDGAYPNFAPDPFKLGDAQSGGNAAWADAGIICPWVIYQRYGDTRILADNYSGMVRWIDHQEKTSDGLVRPDTAFGDWLAPDAARADWAATPCDLIGTAYFAHTAGLMKKIAGVLGRAADSRRFARLHAGVVAAFNRRFVTADAVVAGDSQTAYLLALAFDLLPPSQRPQALSWLVRALQRRNFHLATGFVGTPLLCPVLSRFGRLDLAYRVLLNETYPSWLFPVKNGATTMWERWNSWTPKAGFGEVGMNSFNHYAYGAIGEWLYSTVAGIDALEPGFRRILLRPRPGGGLTHAKASLETPYGSLSSAWTRKRAILQWVVRIPPNTRAIAVPPCASLKNITIDGRPWKRHPGVTPSRTSEDEAAFSLLPGYYRLAVPLPPSS